MNMESDMYARRGHKRKLCSALINREKTPAEVVTENPELLTDFESLQRNLQAYFIAQARSVQRPVAKLLVLTGSSGCGKTHMARKIATDQNFKICDGLTWDNGLWIAGFEDQECLLIDNVDKGNVPSMDWICRLTDPGEARTDVWINQKYGVRASLRPHLVIMTSVTKPRFWWSNPNGADDENWHAQFRRRIACWMHFSEGVGWQKMDTSYHLPFDAIANNQMAEEVATLLF